MASYSIRSVAFVVFFGAASSALFASDPAPIEIRPAQEFKDITPHGLNDHGGKHALEPGWCGTHSVEAAHGEGFFGTAEYLLFRPRRSAFDFAISDANRDLVPNGQLQSLNYELRSGVRAALGYGLGASGWEILFEYTYFASGTDRTLTAPAGGTLYATLTRAGLNDEATAASANASLQYNTYDALIARHVNIDQFTTALLFGGFRFASIRQSFDAIYDGGDANQGFVSTRSDFEGWGPLVGADLAFRIHGGWHVFGRGTAALMTGKLNNPFTETNNAQQTLYASLDNTTRRVIPVLGAAIGGGWAYDKVSIRAGYELSNWFGLIDSPRFTGELAEGKFTTRTGDLSLEGFFVQVGVAY